LNRNYSNGLFLSQTGACTTRGAAWANRTLAQAASATPDSDPLAMEFIASLEANINYNHATYVAQANNPFGIVWPYVNYGTPAGMFSEAAWQQDFYTAAFGYMLALNPGISTSAKAKLIAFFAWKAQSIIGRLGGAAADEWLYADAAPYTMVVAEVTNADWIGGTGPWAASWGALYADTYKSANPGPDAGVLRGGYFPDGTSYWGNLQPAIGYAVRHGVVGAKTAYQRMTGASNFNQLVADFNQNPVWSVEPAPGH
jgi:hypothetical protein